MDRSARWHIFFGVIAFLLVQGSRAADSVPGELLIKFRTDLSLAERNSVLARRGAEIIHRFSTLGIDHVRLTNSRGLRTDAASFASESDILYTQPNYIRHINADPPPNDPQWLNGNLWGLEKIGTTAVWRDFTTGSGNVVIVDIDTGANYNHADLAANIWVNAGEIAANGIDDDGNGYIDDVHGINTAYGNSDPMDEVGHGTHTAGTLAAAGNNGIGVVGVNWKAQVIPCKAFNNNGDATDAALVQCFDYAIALKQRGINIRATNNSYSGPREPNDPFPYALKDAFDRAGAAGIANVCAAGNNGADNDASPHDPASFDSLGNIAVAASDGSNNVTGFTNYGAVSVDLAAPGVDIISTRLDAYGILTGTSMSCPHIAGAVGLLVDFRPDLSVATIKSLILNNVDVLPQWIGKVVSGGRLNLYNTMQSAAFGQQPFSVSSVSRPDETTAQLSWSCAPGLRYQVSVTTNLTSAFAPLDLVLTAPPGQTTMSYTDMTAAGAPRFYKVETVP
ncbi:MAG: S8 family serine peptidase [Verrucomicrobiota bacterium]|nr:S8 family serine peptidase [Verrucomicrobiota bacterium]